MPNSFSISALLILIFGILSGSLQAQDCPCCGPEYREFDFWIGSWTVYDSLDQVVGSNVIEKAQNGCVLEENWTSSGGTTGTSYNYFQQSDSSWNQLWLDDQGGILELKGTLHQGNMVLTSELQKGEGNSLFFHRITWEPSGMDVIQTWEVLNEEKQVLRILFKGFYRKHHSTHAP